MSDPLDLDIPPLDGLRPARASDVRAQVAASPRPRATSPGRPAVADERQIARPQAAAYGYNRLEFHGMLIENPELLTSQKSGRQYCRARIGQPQPDRTGRPGTQILTMLVLNEADAVQFASAFRKGHQAVFIGRWVIRRWRTPQGHDRCDDYLHFEKAVAHQADVGETPVGDA